MTFSEGRKGVSTSCPWERSFAMAISRVQRMGGWEVISPLYFMTSKESLPFTCARVSSPSEGLYLDHPEIMFQSSASRTVWMSSRASEIELVVGPTTALTVSCPLSYGHSYTEGGTHEKSPRGCSRFKYKVSYCRRASGPVY